MKGKYNLVIRNNRVTYELELQRNITIIKGISGSGKTTLYKMFEDLVEGGRQVGIHCNCTDKLRILKPNTDWEYEINSSHNKIFIADEYIDYITTLDFAKIAQNSDNYFILITRTGRAKWLTYSVDCIYSLSTTYINGKAVTKFNKVYKDLDTSIKPDLVITEDSNSGCDMMNSLFNCDVVSARGKDNVYNVIVKAISRYRNIYVIVDGAAFGSCIGRIYERFGDNVYLFTPESFEYLILNTSRFKPLLTTELTETYNFCDSVNYVSWEGYYTDLLEDLSSNINIPYTKGALRLAYKTVEIKAEVKEQLKGIIW